MSTQQPIRIGLIGANIHQGWSPRAHLPALAAHPQFELAAVCTIATGVGGRGDGGVQRGQLMG